MDKLKENLFPISVGAIGIALLVLAYLLVFSRWQALGTTTGQVRDQIQRLRTISRKRPLPIEEQKRQLEEELESKAAALRDAADFYEQKAVPFRMFFENSTEPQPLSTFVSLYNDGVTKLIDEYRTKFGIKVEEGAQEVRPRVSKIEPMDESRLERAMREYWIIAEVFRALEAHGVGGLKSIEFPGRDVAPREPPPYWRNIAFTVEADVEFSKLEDMLTELCASPVVPLILEELTVRKAPDSVAKYLALDTQATFKDAVAASRPTYDELVPEPPAAVTLKFTAVDWKGVPELQEPAPGSARKTE
ncbi:MAG: hypothetical protein ACUVYA_05275 [Planctomycetota bacterium]